MSSPRLTRQASFGILSGLAFTVIALLALRSAGPLEAQGPARRYRIYDLGTLSSSFSRPYAVSNRGQVGGQSEMPDNGTVPFVWSGGTVRPIPGLVGTSNAFGWVAAINDKGTAVGSWNSGASGDRGSLFVYEIPTGNLTFPLGPNSFGVDINNAGQILAGRFPAGGGIIGYVIVSSSGVTDLSAQFGGRFEAYKMNESGFVIGSPAPVVTSSYIYKNGAFVSISGAEGFIGQTLNDSSNDEAAGLVREQTQFFGIRSRAAIRRADGTIRVFSPFNTFSDSAITGLNNLGQAVGTERRLDGVLIPFLIENGLMTNLNALLPTGTGWQLREARDINDRGEIVGDGMIHGEQHAFLMTPELCTLDEDVDHNGNPDNDDDGLCDSWEEDGIDVDRDGTIDLNFDDEIGIILDLNHKDLLVEYDWMDCQTGPATGCSDAHSHEPNAAALTAVLDTFYAGNTFNPDGTAGISLWLIDSEPVPHIETTLFTHDGPLDLDDFNDLKLGKRDIPCDGYVSHPQIRARADCEKKLKAWAMAVRYGIFGHNHAHPVHSSGIAERPGNDFMVTVGGWSAEDLASVGGREEAERAALMHELGHTLGLDHGGGDGVNCKPNYISVMNHALMFKNLDSERPLDFNSTAFIDLDELRLTDTPIRNVEGDLAVGRTVFGLGSTDILYALWDDISRPIDWGLDGLNPPDVGFSQDINRLIGVCEDDSIDVTQSGDPARDGGRLAVLRGFNDWANVRLPFRHTADFADGAGRVAPFSVSEITGAQARAAAEQVDYDGDGVANYPDNCPARANPTQTDSDGDGVGDACDSTSPTDVTPPVITMPGALTVEATSGAGAAVSYTATAQDNVSGALIPICTPASGSAFPLGKTTVTCTATDAAGNSARGSFDAFVVDTTPPVLAAKANLTIPATGANGAVVNYVSPSASDTVDANPLVACLPMSGSQFALGTGRVNCTATDFSGRQSSSFFDVTVQIGVPRIAGSVTGKGRDPSGNFYVDLRLTNTGTGHARAVRVAQVSLRTLAGTGSVTLNTALSPPLPISIAALDVNASTTVRLYLRIPSTVTRFSVTESGTLADVVGTAFTYSVAQSVIP